MKKEFLNRTLVKTLTFICIMAGVFSGLLYAEEEETDETEQVELEPVTVTATRSEEEILDVPQHVTVISAKEIQERGEKNIARVLEAEAGISLIDYGPDGAMQAISLRGSTSAQVLVLINGVRAFGTHGGADMSLISMNDIEQIEIVRGGTSALYGADAVGGVVNIITKKEGENRFGLSFENVSYLPQNSIKGTGGDEEEVDADIMTLFDAQKARMDATYSINNITFTTSINGVLARNEFIFFESPDVRRLRENAELLGGDAYCNVYMSLDHGFINLSSMGTYQEQGSPGNIVSLTPDASQVQTGVGTSLQYKTDTLFPDILTLDVKAYYNYFQTKYVDPLYAEDTLHTTHTVGGDLTQELFLSDYFSLLYGGTINYETLESMDMGDKERLNVAGFMEIPMFPTTYLTLLPSIRYDYFSDFGNSLNFKAGITWKLSSTHGIKGSIAKSFRAPTFNDLYWPASTWAEGNPNLKPETGYCGDAGLTIIKKNYTFNMFLFVRYIEDVILWMSHDDFIWRPTNHDRGLYPGIEAQWDVRVLENFTAGISYTGIYSFSLSGDLELIDNLRIPYTPVHALDAHLGYSSKKHSFSMRAHYEGPKFTDKENTTMLPYIVILNASYTQQVTDIFSIYCAGDNLLNETIQRMKNYPIPGFSLRIGCSLVL